MWMDSGYTRKRALSEPLRSWYDLLRNQYASSCSFFLPFFHLVVTVQHVFHHVIKIRQLFLRPAACLASTISELEWVLTTANAAGTNSLTCLPKHWAECKLLITNNKTMRQLVGHCLTNIGSREWYVAFKSLTNPSIFTCTHFLRWMFLMQYFFPFRTFCYNSRRSSEMARQYAQQWTVVGWWWWCYNVILHYKYFFNLDILL
jgi:hypothetical protein